MDDAPIIIGLGVLLFGLMVGWFAVAARTASTALPPRLVYWAGGVAAAVTALLLTIDALNLGRRLVNRLVSLEGG